MTISFMRLNEIVYFNLRVCVKEDFVLQYPAHLLEGGYISKPIDHEMILRNRTISLLGVTTVITSPRTTKRA